MAFYDNLDEKLARLGRSIVRKVKGTCRSISLSRKIRQEERKQKEIFLEMGRYYYQYYGPEAEGQMKIWCDAIWNNKTMVIQYQGQKRLIKGVTYCPECRKEIPEHSKYCNHCGARVPEKEETRRSDMSAPFSGKVCPKCGAVSREGFVFCSNCGSRLPEEEPDQRKGRKRRKEKTSDGQNAYEGNGFDVTENKKAEEMEEITKMRDQQDRDMNAGEEKGPVAAIGMNEEMTERTGLGASIRKFIREKSEAAKLKDEVERAVEANGFTDDERAVEVETVLEEKSQSQEEVSEKIEVSPEDVVQMDSEEENNNMQGITAAVVIGVVADNTQSEKEESETTVLRCSDCGNVLEKGQNFCPNCGLKVEG